jgi:hypothetical protein
MPETYVVIDLETPKIVKRTNDYRAATLWADTDFAMKSTHVSDLCVRAFSCLTELSLMRLYKNTFGEDLGLRPYGEMLRACYYRSLELQVDETPVATLEAAHKHAMQGLYPTHPDRPAPLPPENGPTDPEWRAMLAEAGHLVPPAPTPGTNGAGGRALPTPAHRGTPSPATRPKPGSTTARVWEICDEAMTKAGHTKLDGLNLKDFRVVVMKQCEAEGINDSTAATQYGKWKSAQGI